MQSQSLRLRLQAAGQVCKHPDIHHRRNRRNVSQNEKGSSMRAITELRKDRRAIVDALGSDALTATELGMRMRRAKGLADQLRALVRDGYLYARKDERATRFYVKPELMR
jgi:uncharacterized membrane protein